MAGITTRSGTSKGGTSKGRRAFGFTMSTPDIADRRRWGLSYSGSGDITRYATWGGVTGVLGRVTQPEERESARRTMGELRGDGVGGQGELELSLEHDDQPALSGGTSPSSPSPGKANGLNLGACGVERPAIFLMRSMAARQRRASGCGVIEARAREEGCRVQED